MYTDEIGKRLRVRDCKRLPRLLEIPTSYDDITNQDELKKMLKVADYYGSKYRQFFKLREGTDIRTITSNLTPLSYSPDIGRTDNQMHLCGVEKHDDRFSIIADFYTVEETWILDPEDNSSKKKHFERRRRVLHLSKESGSPYMVISIDPIGEGERIGRELPGYLEDVFELLSIEILDFFDIIEIEPSFITLIAEGTLLPQNIRTYADNTGRRSEVTATAPTDSLANEAIYTNIINGREKAEKLKLKFGKESIELYGKSLMKITTKIDWEKTDDLKGKIISLL